MSDIQFKWNGKEYTVKKAVYQKDYIVLPNRQVLQPTVWFRGATAPQLLEMKEVLHHLEHAPVGEIAEHFGNAILAQYLD